LIAANLLVDLREEKSFTPFFLPSLDTNLAIVNSGFLLDCLDIGGLLDKLVFCLIGSSILELERMLIYTRPSPVTRG
jgi:hypothetical protein